MLVTFYDLDHLSCSSSRDSSKLGSMQSMLISCSSLLIYTACENCFRSLVPVMQLLTVTHRVLFEISNKTVMKRVGNINGLLLFNGHCLDGGWSRLSRERPRV